MAISLYDATVPTFLQMLGGVALVMQRGLDHCAEHGIDPQEIADTRLHADMFPFDFQIRSVAYHSMGAIDGAKAGRFTAGPRSQSLGYPGLQALIAQTTQAVEMLSPDDVNALAGSDVVFEVGDRKVPFLAEGFLLSFSLPNLHFHATTAYDILRMKGVPLEKRNYLGQMRIKR